MAVQLVSTATLLPQIAPFVPTCPAFVAEQQIRMAAIELAEVSRSWRHVTTVSAVAADETLVAPPFTAIHEIEFAEFEGQPLTPIQFSTFVQGGEGRPTHISQISPGGICLSPFMPGTLRVSLFLRRGAVLREGPEQQEVQQDRLIDVGQVHGPRIGRDVQLRPARRGRDVGGDHADNRLDTAGPGVSGGHIELARVHHVLKGIVGLSIEGQDRGVMPAGQLGIEDFAPGQLQDGLPGRAAVTDDARQDGVLLWQGLARA